MQAEQIAKALSNAKKVNGQWMASCPVSSHGQGNGDRNPSLCITENEEGKPLFKCYGGCSQESVFNAIRDYGLLPDLPDAKEFLTNLKPLPKPQEPVLEQEWHYVDEDGITQHIKQRYKTFDAKGKTYKQFRVDEQGRRHASMTGANIVPYQLPELEHARQTGRSVFLCEGEKAADAIRSIGAYATCTHQGASSFPQDVVKYFVGLTVVIVPDNDMAGWGYATKAVEALKTVTKSIRVIDLGLQEPKEDAYEFVHKYHKTKDDLVDITKATPIIQSEAEIRIPQRLINATSETGQEIQSQDDTETTRENLTTTQNAKQFKLEQFDEIENEPVDWLIQDVMPRRSFTALYAPPASFKSFIALDIAECIATGRAFLGNEVTTTGAVIYIAGEGHGGIGSRIKALKEHHKTPAGSPIYFLRRQVNLRSSKQDLQALVDAIDDLVAVRDEPIELIIIDTLARAFGGGNENASEDMGAFITSAGALQDRYKCSLLAVHHAGKDATKGLRGHSSLLGAVDTELEIIRIEGAKPPQGILHISKQKDGEDGQKLGFRMVEVTPKSTGVINFEGEPSLVVVADKELDTTVKSRSKANGQPPDRSLGGANQVIALQCLHDTIKKFGEMQVVDGMRNKCVTLKQWRDEFRKIIGSDIQESSFNKAWQRARKDLQIYKKVVVNDKLCWVLFDDANDKNDSKGNVVSFNK
jgi:hypothetical protein